MNGYVKQPVHPITNVTCCALTCYAKALFVIVRRGLTLLDGFYCRKCAMSKMEALHHVDLIREGK